MNTCQHNLHRGRVFMTILCWITFLAVNLSSIHAISASIEILPANRYSHYRNLYYNMNFEKVVGETIKHYQREIDKRFEGATLRNVENSKLSDKELKFKLKEKGAKVIVLRQTRYLEIH